MQKVDRLVRASADDDGSAHPLLRGHHRRGVAGAAFDGGAIWNADFMPTSGDRRHQEDIEEAGPPEPAWSAGALAVPLFIGLVLAFVVVVAGFQQVADPWLWLSTPHCFLRRRDWCVGAVISWRRDWRARPAGPFRETCAISFGYQDMRYRYKAADLLRPLPRETASDSLHFGCRPGLGRSGSVRTLRGDAA
jgi:hypothetical protein